MKTIPKGFRAWTHPMLAHYRLIIGLISPITSCPVTTVGKGGVFRLRFNIDELFPVDGDPPEYLADQDLPLPEVFIARLGAISSSRACSTLVDASFLHQRVRKIWPETQEFRSLVTLDSERMMFF